MSAITNELREKGLQTLMIPPSTIDGVAVEPSGEPLEFHGEQWQTLVPDDENDHRIWEFSLTTGRLVRTRAR